VRHRLDGGQERPDLALQCVAAGRVKPAADGRLANRARAYFWLWPIARPNEISPLSIRTLKPQSGLEHTHALYVMGAPSRP